MSVNFSALTLAKGHFLANVKAYGATGDGVTVDTTAIQSAATAVISAGGGIVFVPAGTYLVSGIYLGNNVILRGAGIAASTLKIDPAASTGSVVLRVAPASAVTTTKWVGVEDLTIDGSQSTWGSSSAQKIYGYYMGQATTSLISDCWMTNVEIKNCKSYAFDLENVQGVNLTNCWSHDNGYSSGVGSNNSCSGFTLIGDDITCVNCRSWSNAVDGFQAGQDAVIWHRVQLFGCQGYSNARYGVQCNPASAGEMHNLSIVGGNYNSNTSSGIHVSTYDSNVVGVDIHDNALSGILLDGATRTTVEGCNLKDNATGGAANPEIYLTNSSVRNVVSGNTITSDTASNAIKEQNTSSDFNIITSNNTVSVSTHVVTAGLNSVSANNI